MTDYPLEPDRRAMDEMGRRALALIGDFVDGLPDAPAGNVHDIGPRLPEYLLPPGEGPGDLGDLLDRFGEAAAVAVETAGPRYMAYVGGGGLFTSALAEMVARAFNRYTTLSSFAPALVALEESVLRWLCRQFGLPETAGGATTTGGSLATLVAVVAARHDRLGDDFAGGTLYVTAHTHRCVAKAARLAGLPPAAVRTVPTTPDLRMDPEAAAEMISRDRARGLRPFLLVASAGTTSTGAVDPIRELAQLAQSERLWNHVDAAYGGFFQLTGRGRTRFAGIEHADSVVLDPHKGLFLPHGTGILLVRNPAAVRAAHAVDGAYLQDLDADRPLPDYAELGPELTRDYRGLRIWLPLHLHGVGAFRHALDEKLDLAAWAYRELSADPALELPWEPDLSIVPFRLRGDNSADGHNQRLLERIHATKRLYLSSTRIDGRQLLRLCIISHRTHRPDVEDAVGIIRAAVASGVPAA
jgi:glutamate/tyrosine decarboxylase-like PLP-dependent enzyme